MWTQLAAEDPKEAFAQRQEGDVMEISAEGEIYGGLGVGRNSAVGGLGAYGLISAGAGIKFTSAVSGGKEVIRTTFKKSLGIEGGGHGNFEIASMEGSRRRDSMSEQYVSFTLDPQSSDYAARRAEILGASSIEKLNEIADRPGSPVSGRGNESLQSDMDSTGAALAGIGLAMDQGSFYGESEDVDAEGRKTLTVKGGSTLGGAPVAFGNRLNPASQTDTFSGTTFADGTGEAVAKTEERSINYWRSVATAALRDSGSGPDHPRCAVGSVTVAGRPR